MGKVSRNCGTPEMPELSTSHCLYLPFFSKESIFEQSAVDPRETGNRLRGDSTDCWDVNLRVVATDIFARSRMDGNLDDPDGNAVVSGRVPFVTF